MFNERLRYLRESVGMTQTELARKISVAATTYRNYENTSREPNFDTLVKIANVLGVTTDELLGVSSKNPQLDHLYLLIAQLPTEVLTSLSDYVNYLSLKYRKHKK